MSEATMAKAMALDALSRLHAQIAADEIRVADYGETLGPVRDDPHRTGSLTLLWRVKPTMGWLFAELTEGNGNNG